MDCAQAKEPSHDPLVQLPLSAISWLLRLSEEEGKKVNEKREGFFCENQKRGKKKKKGRWKGNHDERTENQDEKPDLVLSSSLRKPMSELL